MNSQEVELSNKIINLISKQNFTSFNQKDLIEELQAISSEYEVLKGKDFKICFAVDQKLLTDLDSSINGAKEIAFFPPMTGG